MNITDFKDSLDYLVKAELTPFIWGHAGIGKSSIVRQYADKKGFKFFPFYLGTQSDIGDILGLAEFVENEDGTKSTVFATPKWLKDLIIYCEQNPDSGAIIFLDEFNRGRRDVLNGMFSLALDKTFHTIRLPKNCHVIAAGNPPTDEYFTTDVNETALMARFVHVKLEPTFQEWLDFAKGTEVDASLVGFLRNQPELLEEKRNEFHVKDIVKVDRRAFSRLDKLMKLNTPRHLLEQLMHGIIGLERTVAYLNYLKDQDKPLTGKEILSAKKTKLLEKWSNPQDIIASLLNLTCDNLKEELDKRVDTKKDLNNEEMENLMKFFETIPKDIMYPFVANNNLNEVFRKFFLDPKYEDKMYQLTRSAKATEKKTAV